MQTRLPPTTEKNVAARLFLRFFLCYFVTAIAAFFLFRHAAPMLPSDHLGKLQFSLVLLALLGAVLTLSKPYLLILTAVKAFFDIRWLTAVTQALPSLAGGFWAFNACFFYLAFSLFLFCTAAARACLFASNSIMRDTQLLFSKKFAVYLIETVFFAALALSLFYIWPQLEALIQV